jgi:hypothetical protein
MGIAGISKAIMCDNSFNDNLAWAIERLTLTVRKCYDYNSLRQSVLLSWAYQCAPSHFLPTSSHLPVEFCNDPRSQEISILVALVSNDHLPFLAITSSLFVPG